MKKIVNIVLASSLAAASLSGCVAPILMGGAFAEGILVATDRRTSGAQLEDQGIELRAGSRISQALSDRGHINVSSYNRQALLTGEVPTEQDKATAEKIVGQVENVKGVVNELAVLGNSTLTSRSSDALVTSRVKAALIDDKSSYANAFKITTERGIVYMQGLVSQGEADKATEIARNQTGVQKVIRLYEIISDEELKRLLPTPAPKAETVSTPVMSGTGTPLTTTSPK